MSASSWLVATARRNLLHQMATSTPVLEREIAKIGWPFCRNLPWPRKVVSRTLADVQRLQKLQVSEEPVHSKSRDYQEI